MEITEFLLARKNAGGGGDITVLSLTATENKTYNAGTGKAYNPVVVNVPEKQLTTLNADENKTYSPPSGYDGFSEVTVYVPYVTQGTTINENGDYTPPEGVDGFGRVIVDVPTPPPSLQSLTASHNGYFVPSSGYVGFSEVNIDVALPQNAYLLESQKNDVVTIQHGAEFDMPKLIASIEPQQSGSGDPSPTNIRPISGWTACNVARTGKNLCNTNIFTPSTMFTVNDDGSVTQSSTDNRSESNMPTISLQKGTYTLTKTAPSTGGGALSLYYKDANNQWVWVIQNSYDSVNTFTLTEDADVYLKASMNGYYPLTYKIQIEVGSRSTDFEKYNTDSHTYTINFVDGSSPLTVYGGTLDVLSGVLTITDGFIASYNGETLPSTWISDRDVYAEGTTPTTGAEVCYKLATPQTYQLTPTEVKSLLGVNNIFADTGEVDVQIWTKE